MSQLSLFRLLLTPSLLSGFIVSFCAFSFLAYRAWLYLSDNHVLYDYLFGPYGLETILWQNSLVLSTQLYGFLVSPSAYYILLTGVALITGFAVFTLLQFLSVIFRGTAHFLVAAEDSVKPATLFELVSKLSLRVLSVAGWAVYGAYFVGSILPFTIVLNQIGIDNIKIGYLAGYLACGGAYLLLACTLHLHVVFARLTLLRPRVFRNNEAIATEMD